MRAPVAVSIVIPCHNEEANLRPLLAAIHQAVDPLGIAYEVVVTDDASTDGSWDVLRELAATDPALRIQAFVANCGESAASWAGMQAARAPVIVTLDADLQNDPADIPRFLAALEHADCVCGTRLESRGDGDGIVRVLSSRIANFVRTRLGGGTITDAGCTYRAFRRACLANLRPFRGIHRFLPTLIEMDGFRVAEVPVRNRARTAGKSHYGIRNRILVAFVDLLAVRWMRSRIVRYELRDEISGEARPADAPAPPRPRASA